jgi:hypothetical protein
VLRALGLTARQVSACVSWLALATGVLAVLVGLPLGVIVGQRVWRGITDQLSFVYLGPFAGRPLALAGPLCLIGFMLLAIVTARNIARRRIADTLREE